MNAIKRQLAVILVLSTALFAVVAKAGVTTATPAVSGYDVVSYHQDGGPVRGDGSYIAEYDGETYLFASEENKATFEADPEKYAPAYGGYCAYGVTAGKKFHTDPLAWRIEDGKLYLNLNAKVQTLWLKDVPGNIAIADEKWVDIESTPAAQL